MQLVNLHRVYIIQMTNYSDVCATGFSLFTLIEHTNRNRVSIDTLEMRSNYVT